MKYGLIASCVFSLFVVGCASSAKNRQTELEIAMKEYQDGKDSAAMPIFKEYCQKNERASCTRVGSILTSKGNTKEAQEFFKKSCSLGDPWGCQKLGQTYFKEKNYDFAFPIFEKSCVELNESCLYLGIIEILIGKNKESVNRFKALCNSDIQSACFYIGYIEFKSKNFSKANSYFNKGCSLGNSLSCLYLPDTVYLVGNKSRAVKLAEFECVNGSSARGCRIVELIKKTKSQPQLSQVWEVECKKGNGASCYWLGLHQSLDKETYDTSFKSWIRACELGYGFGCTELGNFSSPSQKFINSEYTSQIYTEACNKEANSACTILGEKNLPESKKYSYSEALNRGCDLRDGRACTLLASKIGIRIKKPKLLRGTPQLANTEILEVVTG